MYKAVKNKNFNTPRCEDNVGWFFKLLQSLYVQAVVTIHYIVVQFDNSEAIF